MKIISSQKSVGDPGVVRSTDYYQTEYARQVVEKWDELIDWKARAASEGSFFIDALKERGVRRVLDVATGTGFHSVRLLEAGFDVTSADGNAEMLGKAFANGRQHGRLLRTVQADWRWLNRDVDDKFDAVICLGNSFPHLFSEHDRRKVLAEFYTVLRHDGIVLLDHRNYDLILNGGFRPNHAYYYCGDRVKVFPEHVDGGLARFCYQIPDEAPFYLNTFPLRKDYLTRLFKEVGFQKVTTCGHFYATYRDDEPDFFIHLAEKQYCESDALPDRAAA